MATERRMHTNGPAAGKALPPPPQREAGPPRALLPAPPRRHRRATRAPIVVAVVMALLGAVFATTSFTLWRAVDRVDDDVAGLRDALEATGESSEALGERIAALEGQVAAEFDAAGVVDNVAPSVFAIIAPTGEFVSLGSGFVLGKVDHSSLLVTNYHVIAERWEAGANDVLVTRGQREYVGEITRVSPADDLALIEVPADFPSLEAAETPVRVGDPVVVIGSPLDPELEGTVTTGIVSAVDRSLDGLPWLQFSAAINPGNSGGPVVDADGQVVGVATLKVVGGEGLGFAIPIERVCSVLELC